MLLRTIIGQLITRAVRAIIRLLSFYLLFFLPGVQQLHLAQFSSGIPKAVKTTGAPELPGYCLGSRQLRGHHEKKKNANKEWPARSLVFPLVTAGLTPLEPQSRFGDKQLEIWLACHRNGTAALKGLNWSPCL